MSGGDGGWGLGSSGVFGWLPLTDNTVIVEGSGPNASEDLISFPLSKKA